MKAMILAAGRGERLRPITDTLPKPLVAVNGKPLIEYHLEKLAAIGIKQVIINHAWLGHLLPETLGNGERWGLSIQYSAETEALETAGGIKQALSLLGTEPFLLLNGDIFIDELPDIALALRILNQQQADAYIWFVENPAHHPQGDFSLDANSHHTHFETDSASLVKLEGELKFTYSGMGIYHPQMFAGLAEGSQPLGPLLRQSIAQEQIYGHCLSQYWCDVGTIARLDALNARLKSLS
ncbi:MULTISPECIES: N-acetylmuramate alpha-1-phosphate uridylyltransferase MurU [Pseudomonadati]|uniref:Nucleotidyltransferase family protein n=1 Tax=Shewanella aestuarii TaxID=1028752 RepID=A0ABT0L0H8_9GAMM|nr:nucleotidyltransferase family protein [Shewanella aestuarii]MCL1117195.1 nucleotidyltransferase family protein [Shewanella aestuarii]GGN74070.1 mannose-1-phosphate guanylyltransferase [Shewanella aestuarii]